MKYFRYLSITFLFLLSNAYAYQPKVEIIEQFDNLKMIAFISQEDINSTPEWNPNLETPPMTTVEAIKALKKSIKALGSIKEIEIRKIPKHNDLWHYLIKVSDEKMTSKVSIYVVLMNGIVVPGIIEPQGYK